MIKTKIKTSNKNYILNQLLPKMGDKDRKNSIRKICRESEDGDSFLLNMENNLPSRNNSEFLKYRGKDKIKWLDGCRIRKRKKGFIYIVEMRGNGEIFCKVGITTSTIKRRFNHKFPYRVFLYYIKRHENLKILYDKETQVLVGFSNHKYTPKIKFGGCTECFDIEIMDKLKRSVRKTFIKELDKFV